MLGHSLQPNAPTPSPPSLLPFIPETLAPPLRAREEGRAFMTGGCVPTTKVVAEKCTSRSPNLNPRNPNLDPERCREEEDEGRRKPATVATRVGRCHGVDVQSKPSPETLNLASFERWEKRGRAVRWQRRWQRLGPTRLSSNYHREARTSWTGGRFEQ